MKRWLVILLLACSCGPCCPCKEDCPCDAQQPRTSIDHGYYAANNAQPLFAWSPHGKSYHANACVVKASDGKCGSGTYIQYGGMTGVLTCQHVVGGRMTATFSDGKQLSGDPITDKLGNDIAWFAVTHPTLKPLSLSATAPAPGERVEFVSRGGPKSGLRHWFGSVQSDGDKLTIDANITPGDSGGGIVNSRGEVIGVSTDGQTTAALAFADGRTILNPDPSYAKRVYESNQAWIVYGTAGSPGYGPIRRFLQRVHARLQNPFCPDGNCPDYSQPDSGGRYGPLYPPSEQPETPDYTPPVPSTEVAELRERIDSLEKSLQGPKGDKGDAGKSPSADEVAASLVKNHGNEIAGKIKVDIPPLYVESSPGKPLVAVDVANGQPLKLHEVVPPLYVEVVDPTGKYSAPPQAIRFMDGEGLRLTLDPTQIVLPKAN